MEIITLTSAEGNNSICFFNLHTHVQSLEQKVTDSVIYTEIKTGSFCYEVRENIEYIKTLITVINNVNTKK